jgi:ribosomal protein S18 acetylase RimI-like enzyme
MIRVRKARPEDLDAIDALTDEMHNYLADLYGLKLSSEELEDEHFDEEELKGNVYVAESEENKIVGYVCFSRAEDEMAGPHYEVEHIAVGEKHRGLSVGRALFNVVLEQAKKEKVNITTGTLARNKGALKFYEKLGFKPFTVGLIIDLQKRMYKK